MRMAEMRMAATWMAEVRTKEVSKKEMRIVDMRMEETRKGDMRMAGMATTTAMAAERMTEKLIATASWGGGWRGVWTKNSIFYC